VLAVLAIVPASLCAQTSASGPQYAPADPQVPIPYGSTRPEDGGFYTGLRVLLYRLSNPLRQQNVAVRGFVPYDSGVGEAQDPTQQGTVLSLPPFPPGRTPALPVTYGPGVGIPTPPGVPAPSPGTTRVVVTPNTSLDNGSTIVGGVIFNLDTSIANPPVGYTPQAVGVIVNVTEFFNPGLPGDFIPGQLFGSGTPALDVAQLDRRNSYQPGFEIDIGWKFRDGSAVTLSWLYITETQYRAGATLAPPGPNPGPFLEETFLFSPVINFPVEYAGADFKINPPGNVVNPQTVFGIWNGASMMTISFRQWFQQWEISYREPIWETETYRVNGIVGPRYTWIWEKFKWVTTSIGQNTDGTVGNNESPAFVGIYSNITSNRMYGVHAGCEQEWYIGRGFAFHIKTEAALFLDSAKEKAKYETAAKYLGLPTNKQTKVEWAVVPELQLSTGLMWYPTEFVQMYVGYDLLAFFNTRASPRPIDFDYSNINPRWTHVNRLIDGFNAGIAFTW
jgi:hypothetical protein